MIQNDVVVIENDVVVIEMDRINRIKVVDQPRENPNNNQPIRNKRTQSNNQPMKKNNRWMSQSQWSKVRTMDSFDLLTSHKSFLWYTAKNQDIEGRPRFKTMLLLLNWIEAQRKWKQQSAKKINASPSQPQPIKIVTKTTTIFEFFSTVFCHHDLFVCSK